MYLRPSEGKQILSFVSVFMAVARAAVARAAVARAAVARAAAQDLADQLALLGIPLCYNVYQRYIVSVHKPFFLKTISFQMWDSEVQP